MADDTATVIQDGEKVQGTVSDKSTDYWKGVAERYQQQLDAQKKSTAEQLALTREAQQQQLDYSTRQQKQGYDATAKQLYIDKMNREKELPQQLAALGITGGAAESSLIGIGAGYESQLAENERARANALAALGQTALQNDYQARANAMGADAQAQQQYMAQINAMEQQKYQQKLQEAETREAAGDFSLSVELGLYTQEEADRLYKIWAFRNKKLAEAVDGTGKKSGGARKDGPMTREEFLENAKAVQAAAGTQAANDYLRENAKDFGAADNSWVYRQLTGTTGSAASGRRRTGAQE